MLKGGSLQKLITSYKFTIKNNSIKNIIYIHLQALQKNDISQLQSNQVCLMCAG
jgi:hypothetical protein